jgi:hypothetical protein
MQICTCASLIKQPCSSERVWTLWRKLCLKGRRKVTKLSIGEADIAAEIRTETFGVQVRSFTTLAQSENVFSVKAGGISACALFQRIVMFVVVNVQRS